MKHLIPIVLLASALCSSCRTVRVIEQVPVEVHDTISQKVFLHDSTYIDRWHTVEVKGDTVFATDIRVESKYVTRYDTVYKSVEKPVTLIETVEVAKPLSWWQKGLMWAGAIGILTALAVVVVRLRRRTS